jgi:hypothetical protein
MISRAKLDGTFEADTLREVAHLMIQAAMSVLEDAIWDDTLGAIHTSVSPDLKQSYSYKWDYLSAEGREQGDPAPSAAPAEPHSGASERKP